MSWDGGRVVGSAAVALGLATILMAGGLREGTATGGPGTRFLPVLLGGLMVLLGGIIVFGRAPAPSPPSGTDTTGDGGLVRPLVVLAAMACYALLFERLGFLLSTAPVLAFLLVVHGERRWGVVLAVSVLASAATYGLFGLWLKVPLPSGLLDRWGF
jgi:putative tricarboxylic transport membrane protein